MATPGPTAVSRKQVLERYRHLREDHLRYMQKWGIVRPVSLDGGDNKDTLTNPIFKGAGPTIANFEVIKK